MSYYPFESDCPGPVTPKTAKGTIFTDGVPDDIEPSHVVIGGENYYITMGYHSTRYIVVLGVILIILFVIMLIAFSFYNGYNKSVIEPPVPSSTGAIKRPNIRQGAGPSQTISFTGDNDGQSLVTPIECSNPDTMSWNNVSGVCSCLSPYWGGNCNRESYKPRYLALGVVDPTQITITTIGDPTAQDRLSYAKSGGTSCTDLCDATIGCVGVVWDRNVNVGGTCTLFSQITPDAGFMFNFDPNVDSNVYVNQHLTAFNFTDRVIVFSGTLQPSWWQGSLSQTVLVAFQNTRYQLNFFPEIAYNTTNFTGLYALYPFDIADFSTLVAAGSTSTTYVVAPGQSLQVPIEWFGQPIWVMYNNYP